TSVATQESVPAAFAVLAVHPHDPWEACRLGASVGGDCDTIAAMAGAVAGACWGKEAFPAWACKVVEEVNQLDLEPLVDALLRLRDGSVSDSAVAGGQ
ncbi:MAG: ADP-ribosylglycohydrolase family protein, partial [Alicyclobacillus sp.]|nr:ADP-ribosylglycohydrolase family protein [Alicyclobacillus sp.]